MPYLAALKYVGIGVSIVALIGGFVAYRNSLITMGENIIKAQDNAALVKAQQEQTANDAIRIQDQQRAIADLSRSGQTAVEQIRYVQAPCKNDGVGDPRLNDTVDWLRQRPGYNLAPDNRQPPKGTVSAPTATAPKR